MARQWFMPTTSIFRRGAMIDEDGEEEYFVPGVAMINEDQAAVSESSGIMVGLALLRRRRR